MIMHGIDAVGPAGIEALGFPGTWITDRGEAEAVRKHLDLTTALAKAAH